MRTATLLLSSALCALTAPAFAYSVSPGCAVPPSVSSGKVWYIDPVNGKTQTAGGDGSQANPWNSLTAVGGTKINGTFGPDVGYTQPLLSTVKGGFGGGTGPIHPGDTIMLMSGNYGAFTIGDFNFAVTNSDWIRVVAAPGQTPVIASMGITRTNKWVFDGLKVQSQGPGGALVNISDQGAAYPTKDIVLTNMDISSIDNYPTGWTQAMWAASANTGILAWSTAGTSQTGGEPNTSCVSITDNNIHDVAYGIQLFANDSLASRNHINRFADDAMDYGANNLALTNNLIENSFNTANGIHTDAMQGQNGAVPPGFTFNKFSNLLIDGNIIIRQTDPNLKFTQYLQGIDAFDEDWTNVTVTNNVIITSSCWGISFGSTHHGLFAGNTVAFDKQVVLPNCVPLLLAGGVTHQGLPSSDIRVTNNFGTRIVSGGANDTNVTMDNNYAAMAGGFGYFDHVANQIVFFTPPGTDASGNVTPVADLDLTKVFKTWNPSGYSYDLSLLATAPIVGTGSRLPATDILGISRSGTIAPGAYALWASIGTAVTIIVK